MSYIVKHIYNFGSDEVIRRGKKIFLTGGVKLLRREEVGSQLVFKVRNDQYYNQYTVTVSKYQQAATLQARCQCPYNMGEICRHEVAALFQLNDMLENQTLDTSQASFNQMHTLVRMKSIELKSLRLFTSNKLFEEAESLISLNRMHIERAENELVEASITDGDEIFPVKLKRNDDKSFDTSCTCSEHKHPLCKHKAAVFLKILNQHGEHYFDTIRNWESQKNKLLSLYGYSLAEDLTGKFEFYYQEGKPFLKVLDPSIKKVSLNNAPPPKTEHKPIIERTNYTKRLGIVINLQEPDFPFFTIDLVEGELAEHNHTFAGNVQKVDISKYVNPEDYPQEDRDIISMARRLQKSEIEKYVAKNSPFGDLWENIIHKEDITDETKQLLYEYLHPKLLKLFHQMGDKNPIYLLPQGQVFKTNNLVSVEFAHNSVFPILQVNDEKEAIAITIRLQIDGQEYRVEESEIPGTLIYLFDGRLYLANKQIDAYHIGFIKEHALIPKSQWQDFLNTQFLEISKQYESNFQDNLVEHIQHIEPVCAIHLSEQGSYFILKPAFYYENSMAFWSEENSITGNQDGKVIIIRRDKAREKSFMEYIQLLNPHLRKPDMEPHFALHSKYAMHKNWFFEFFERIKEDKIPLYGYENLKQFRIHQSKPNTKVHISSQLDWFDTEIEVHFGEETAQLSDIQTALATKQNFVPLSDGTYGLLPEEWLQKFSLLFKMADGHGKKLKVSKYNFTVIDELYDLIDDEAIQQELQEKKSNLLSENHEQFYSIPVPEEVTATLRPYQIAGFQWLSYLDKVQWGGLLADDMGLGKTIQTLTFLQYFKNQHEGVLTAIVVCPTTLIFNWEKEIQKFTPQLRYVIHHGPLRTTKHEGLAEHDIIISTYGTLRSDIDMFAKITFDYAVLDESQTIKNPVSKIAKAANLLNTKNRIALSGTPMQNNTFDMYSQMNFLNPGMLGTKEFFKEQFAKQIDKFQDVEAKKHLRKLIYPFLLRRTKEQVARDLPEKTEITLFCEMGPEQRNLYEIYRNRYRSQILGTIDNQGIEKSQFAILQGLMKLRQLCDSPAILKDEAKLPNHSVKLDELVRELQENMGNHKALVFSQFLGMLDLIRKKLKEEGIPFQYFDGSYTAQQRETAIKDFQDNEECRVFLISLKAGGMGLNLTSADYVYLVDPWWNPAVEQQAIDRTHRIGQTKNIFAYRLICKDTVEEKIMILKERKNSLVKDIVSDDSTMIKQLTKDDVNYLFS
jgi:SNF2 family DNA or RNA helicase